MKSPKRNTPPLWGLQRLQRLAVALPSQSISWFEAQEFIHKYNLWLFANARDSLPRCGKTVGFVRLPTEVEWEFAARGAIRCHSGTVSFAPGTRIREP